MPPRPDDNYNPVATVNPSTGAPNDYLNNRASAQDFGGQVGQAFQGLGKTVEQTGNEQANIEIQRLGLANEHAANMAELRLATEGGDIYNKYKSMEGLDAANSRQQAVQDYLALNNKIRDSLGNPAAQRAYDQLATRRIGFTIQDINGYAADQTKKAYRDGNTASMNLSLENMTKSEVVNDPKKFEYEKQSAIFQANTLFTAPTYGIYQTVPATTGKDGYLKFDTSTDQGKMAQANYDNYVSTMLGKGYKNAVDTLAFSNDPSNPGSVTKAVNFLEQNKASMPPAVYASLSHSLVGPYRQEQARQGADQTIADLDAQYNGHISSIGNSGVSENFVSDTIKRLLPGVTITSGLRTPEDNERVNGVSNSMHLSGQAIDVVLPKGMSPVDFKQQLISNGINPTEFLVEKKGDPNSTGDHLHVGWGIKNPVTGDTSNYVPKADFYRQHYDDVTQKLYADAQKLYPNDSTFADQYVARGQAKMNNVIHGQELELRANTDLVKAAVAGKDNNGVPLTDMSQIENSPDPKVRDAYHDWITQDWTAPQKVTNLIASYSRGMEKTYGTNFYTHLLDGLSGKVTDSTKFIDDIKPAAGKNSPLTNLGFNTLDKIVSDAHDPQNHAFNQAEMSYLQSLQKLYTGLGFKQGVTQYSTTPQFNQVLQEVLPRIDAGKAKGLTATQMFSPKINGRDNPDYIFPSKQPPSLAEVTKQDMRVLNPSGTNSSTAVTQDVSAPSAGTYKTIDDVGKAMQAGKLTRAQAHQYIQDHLGGFAPSVPMNQ